MFTGLVEAMGRIREARLRPGGRRLFVGCDFARELAPGDSVAVDGVCLTAARVRSDGFEADVIRETCDRTTLGDVRVGHPVNLERALRLGDRLGGHLVQGHVDGTATVLEVRRGGDDHRVRLELEAGLQRFVAFKGSVALHGVSLTVSACDRRGFEVALIPETLERTTLGRLRGGERLNVEVDLLARYLDRLLDRPSSP